MAYFLLSWSSKFFAWFLSRIFYVVSISILCLLTATASEYFDIFITWKQWFADQDPGSGAFKIPGSRIGEKSG